jgi:hypothetical protein
MTILSLEKAIVVPLDRKSCVEAIRRRYAGQPADECSPLCVAAERLFPSGSQFTHDNDHLQVDIDGTPITYDSIDPLVGSIYEFWNSRIWFDTAKHLNGAPLSITLKLRN